MTNEMIEWKRVLDGAIEHYLASHAPDAKKELLQETYDQMFRKMMEKDKLLDTYRKDHSLLKESHRHLIEEVRSYKQRLGEVV